MRASIGGSVRHKPRFQDARASLHLYSHRCRGLMHPFVDGIALTSPHDPRLPSSHLVFFFFARHHTLRSHKRFYVLHLVRVKERYLNAVEYSTAPFRTSCEDESYGGSFSKMVTLFSEFFFTKII